MQLSRNSIRLPPDNEDSGYDHGLLSTKLRCMISWVPPCYLRCLILPHFRMRADGGCGWDSLKSLYNASAGLAGKARPTYSGFPIVWRPRKGPKMSKSVSELAGSNE